MSKRLPDFDDLSREEKRRIGSVAITSVKHWPIMHDPDNRLSIGQQIDQLMADTQNANMSTVTKIVFEIREDS